MSGQELLSVVDEGSSVLIKINWERRIPKEQFEQMLVPFLTPGGGGSFSFKSLLGLIFPGLLKYLLPALGDEEEER